MRARFLKVMNEPGASFHLREESVPYFDNPWHFHPELELTLILKGRGTRFVGDSVGTFAPGDLTFIGANLPHYWKCDPDYYREKEGLRAEAVILRFSVEQLGLQWGAIPEMQGVAQLFRTAKRGMLMEGETARVLGQQLKALLQSQDAERYIGLLSILNGLAQCTQYRLLSSEGFAPRSAHFDERRMQQVCEHVFSHYAEPLSLQGMAELTHMNPSAFSRYFKKCSGKNFYAFLTEVRIGQACRLLIESGLSITQVQLSAGFTNQASFNQQFKKLMGMTPMAYRKLH